MTSLNQDYTALQKGLALLADQKPRVYELVSAIKYGDVKLVKALLDRGVNYDEPDEKSITPLHYAACQKSPRAPAIVQILLDKGVALEPKDLRGEVPLDYAEGYGLKETVQMLKDAPEQRRLAKIAADEAAEKAKQQALRDVASRNQQKLMGQARKLKVKLP